MEHVGFILFLLAYIQPTQRLRQGLPSGKVFKHVTQSEPSQTPVCTYKIRKAIQRCEQNMRDPVMNGFPWCVSSQMHDSHLGPSQDIVGDPMDCLNHVCEVFDEFQDCLAHKSIPGVCVLSDSASALRVDINFNFICHRQKRSTDLIHALQCLKQTRDLELLMYRMAERHGPGFADAYAQGNKNALWRFLNAESLIFTPGSSPFAYHHETWKVSQLRSGLLSDECVAS